MSVGTVSPQFIAANIELARNTRVLVRFWPADTHLDPAAVYSLGDAAGALPFVVTVDPVSSRFSMDRLVIEPGDVTVEIVTTPGSGQPGIVQLRELCTPSRLKGLRLCEVLIGFRQLLASQFVPVLAGPVRAATMTSSSYTIRASDGLDLARYVRLSDIAIPELFPPSRSITEQTPIDLVQEMIEAILQAAGDPDATIDNSDIFRATYPYPYYYPVDKDLLWNVLWLLLNEQNPKEGIEIHLLPGIAAFLGRSDSSGWSWKEIRPVDKKTDEKPDIPYVAVIDDNAILAQPVVTYETAQLMRSITIRWGLMVWDFWDDYAKAGPMPLAFEQRDLHQYMLSQTFGIAPDATQDAPGSYSDMREATVSVPWAACTEGDPNLDDVLHEVPDGDRQYYPTIGEYQQGDDYGFPVLYRWDRRAWSDDWHTWYPVSAAQFTRGGYDIPHSLARLAARYLRATGLAAMTWTAPVQTRVAALIQVGDPVQIASRWTPDPGRGRIGYASQQDAPVGMVVSRSLDMQHGAVELSVRLPITEPDGQPGGLIYPRFELQRCYVQYGTVSEAIRTSASLSIGISPITTFDAWGNLTDAFFRITEEDGTPRAVYDATWGHRFHYIRWVQTLRLSTDDVEDGVEYRVWYRVSILTKGSFPKDPERFTVLYSHKRCVGVIIDGGIGASLTVYDSILPAGCRGLDPSNPPAKGTIVMDGKITSIEEGLYGPPDYDLIRDEHADFVTAGIRAGDVFHLYTTDAARTLIGSGEVLYEPYDPMTLRIQVIAPPIYGNLPYPYAITRDTAGEYDPDAGKGRPYLTHEEETIGGVRHPAVWGIKWDIDRVERVVKHIGGLIDWTARLSISTVELYRLRTYDP